MALINTTTTGVLGSTFFGDGTGPLTVQQNGVTLGIYGNIPVLYATKTDTQTLTNNSWTKVALNSKTIDTNSNFDTTNYRFTPTVAGYYLFSGVAQMQAFTGLAVAINKNNIGDIYGVGVGTSAQVYSTVNIQKIFYMNGTTDYVELFAYQASGSSQILLGGQNVLQGTLIKAA